MAIRSQADAQGDAPTPAVVPSGRIGAKTPPPKRGEPRGRVLRTTVIDQAPNVDKEPLPPEGRDPYRVNSGDAIHYRTVFANLHAVPFEQTECVAFRCGGCGRLEWIAHRAGDRAPLQCRQCGQRNTIDGLYTPTVKPKAPKVPTVPPAPESPAAPPTGTQEAAPAVGDPPAPAAVADPVADPVAALAAFAQAKAEDAADAPAPILLVGGKGKGRIAKVVLGSQDPDAVRKMRTGDT